MKRSAATAAASKRRRPRCDFLGVRRLSSILAHSVALLNGGLKAAAGQAGTYRRGNEAIDEVIAIPAKPQIDDYGDEAAAATAKQRDWIFLAADLKAPNGANTTWTPQRNDKWTAIGPDGVVRWYEVLPRDGERVFRPTDPTGLQLRVFTVEIKAPADE